MILQTTKLRDAISVSLALGTTALAGTGTAQAQEAEATAGSHHPRPHRGDRFAHQARRHRDLAADLLAQPRRHPAQGLTSVGDVIQNITANGSTLNTTFNNGGNGDTGVSLRNLGANRTLVLVNGRRWVGGASGTGLGGQVDLNSIPTAAVERIEVLKDGASSIYGSDAIAGVVNVILRQNFEGAEANAYLGQYDKGDGIRQSYDFTIGTTSDRFAAMLGFGYVKEDPVMAGDRYISKEPIYTTGAALGGSSTTPNGNFGVRFGECFTDPADPDAAHRLPPGRRLARQLHLRRRRRATHSPGVISPTRHLQLRAGQLPADTAGAPLGLRQRLGRNHRRHPLQDHPHLQRAPVRAAAGGHAGRRWVCRSPAPTPATWSSAPTASTTRSAPTSTGVQRRAIETGGRSFNQDVRTFAMNAGLEGTLTFSEKYFDWEAGLFLRPQQGQQHHLRPVQRDLAEQRAGPVDARRQRHARLRDHAGRPGHGCRRLRADEHARRLWQPHPGHARLLHVRRP